MGNLVAELSKSNNILSGYCPYCGSRVHLLSSHKQSELIRDSYVECNNKRCGHRYLLQISFVHTTALPKYLTVSHHLPLSKQLQSKLKSEKNDNISKTNEVICG
ncbi:ogr/Delta-like zinc finger family protein [Zymomonas mobilis]|uniref:Transcriptional activator Ogr/delta n=1 Tax=Zymomonas mobilis subsp. mobilis (strain ATCC 31821 / ZM4 / CP4) TaxID=264203 RepID=A0A806CJR1_ZYMMO|nr:ogr/Delta-like zinc finger family protein [Zymomonas mobilis]ADC33822.1 transcriptional activator Ogr/delta [Zymomonas mobilis subsp. mobilis ZM4 = ATCC 31821]AHB11043.1 zinc finger protein, Ogr/Delta-like protein [Zymomonas mobilis subsp. mobilis str. CP4 = NRRL B-14023]AHJ71409.1 Ogr/Delta-like zinc finger [Zymomonas mobilis subsp. mobilis NRRL B-12526]AHJ73300.1 Ogr/Delta-like zinc finger [Zymomonas mobilis subsp. mobilis str. CP4 = NRRL B-14023]